MAVTQPPVPDLSSGQVVTETDMDGFTAALAAVYAELPGGKVIQGAVSSYSWATTGGSQTVAFQSFPTPYASGVVPSITITPEAAAGPAAIVGNLIPGSVTNLGFQVRLETRGGGSITSGTAVKYHWQAIG